MKKEFNILETDFEGEIIHDYYPRPTMERKSFINLNGEWDFCEKDYKMLKNVISQNIVGTKDKYFLLNSNDYNEKIIVPFCMESALSKINRIHKKHSVMFYKREFDLTSDSDNPVVILHFGAVDCITNVKINGSFVGRNKGGYLPFEFEITNFVNNGKNIIEVEVTDDLNTNYPYGKQRYKRGGMWYTPVSGIWQTVWIEQVPENYIEGIKIEPSVDTLCLSVYGGENKKTLIFDDNEYEFEGENFELEIPSPILWSPENPFLYYFTLKSGNDKVKSYFALRQIRVDSDDKNVSRIFLNNEPYFFSGLLDQGYFPDGLFLPKNINGFINDLMEIKKLGFNMIRKHIKVEPEIYYYLCDKIGICVFQDMVNNGSYSFLRDTALPTIISKKRSDKNLHKDKLSRKIFETSLKGIVRHLYNHPSVVYWTIFNEGWGQFCADKMYDILKSEDDTRVIDSTSGWFKAKNTDVESEHIYFKPVKVMPNSKPIILSEFGGYSYKINEHSYNLSKTYGYRFYTDQNEFMNGLEKLYIDEVLPYIKDGLCGCVYTQTSDVEDETNGVMTYDRKVIKVDSKKMWDINQKLYEENKNNK